MIEISISVPCTDCGKHTALPVVRVDKPEDVTEKRFKDLLKNPQCPACFMRKRFGLSVEDPCNES
jgi:transposase